MPLTMRSLERAEGLFSQTCHLKHVQLTLEHAGLTVYVKHL